MRLTILHAIWWIALLAFSPALFAQSIVLNEVVASNSVQEDEDGDTPDWFELHNPTATLQSLAGWTVSDDPNEPDQWPFPDMSIPAGGYLLVWASDKDRRSPGIPRTLIRQGDIFSYRLGINGIPANWTTLGFDDSGWATGLTGIGYGDGDDATIVPDGTRSVYLRRSFTVADPEQITDLILDMDYDDAFVAYLNGVEIARANIQGFPPNTDATAEVDREATLYGGGIPERTLIADAATLLQAGENILSIQVHNVTSFSSDMSLIAFLSARYIGASTEGTIPPALLNLQPERPHTNFKLSAAGETLYLYDAEGLLVDTLAFEQLLADVSYGRLGEDDRVYFQNPTPESANGGPSFGGIITSAVEFSHPGGATNPITLSLSGAGAGEAIHYTLDASEPSADSPLYTGAISIDETTVVRAQIFRDNYLPLHSASRTYLLDIDHDLPVISLVTEPDNFFHPDTGMYVLGEDYTEDEFPYFGSNIWEEWERPIHFSLYETDGELAVSFNAGTKIFGGWSRANEQRSLSIFARSRYGANEIDYPLFPNRPFDSYQAIVLRNSGNDWLRSMLRDGTLTSLLEGADLETQAYRPTAAYLNGEYWGIYNMREKVNEHFLAARHGVDPNEIDILEFGGEVIQGSNAEYLELIDFVASNNLSVGANYDWVTEQVDIDNIILYHVAQIYLDNRDWPGNNIKFWRAPGVKWRWILFDTDFGFGVWTPWAYTENTLAFALEANGPGWPNPPWSTLLFRQLMENMDFRHSFVNRFADEMNSRFLPDLVEEHINSKAEAIATEIPAHYTRWEGNSGEWPWFIDVMKNFGNNRQAFVKGHILDQFSLPAYHPLTIEIEDTAEGFVQVNTLSIDVNEWTGDYFQNVPVPITAVARPGYTFSHWTIGSTAETAELSVNLAGALTLRPVFEPAIIPDSDIIINEINYSSSDDWDTGDWVELHNRATEAIDLSGWVYRDDDDAHSFLLPEGTLISAEGYLVLARNMDDLLSFHPELDNVIGDVDFGLSSAGDQVRIFDAEGNLVDAISYLPGAPWPSEANGEGPTLELANPALDNDLVENWAILHPHGSPGISNLSPVVAVTEVTAETFALAVAPNPFTDQLMISFYLPEAAQVNIDLYDLHGHRVHRLSSLGVQWEGLQRSTMHLGHLPRGLYLAQALVNGKVVAVDRWVKM